MLKEFNRLMARNNRKRRKKNSSSSPIVLWLFVAIALGACAWLYAAHKKSSQQQQVRELKALSQVKGADAASLIYTVIPDSLASQKKDYEGFTVDFNASNHTPNYVGWELLASQTEGNVKRTDNFWYDREIKGCPDIPDYKRSGYDRGHMYPAADAKWSVKSMNDCFSFANMAPQVHALNNGAWKTLEEKERLWAKRDKRLIIVAGPLYSPSDTQTIGNIGVRVPSGYFKVLLAPDVEKPRAIAFVYPNDLAPGNMQNYSMSVDEAEILTGFDFFSALPDSIENIIESTASFKEWNQR